jgi:hypothetical protein
VKTHDVILFDDGETWGGPGSVIRIPPGVLARHKDEYDNGRLRDIVEDPGTTILYVEGLVAIYDFLKKVNVRNPKLKRLLERACGFQGNPTPAGDAKPIKESA